MLLPSRRKIERLPDGDAELTPAYVLADAVSGLRGISLAVAVMAGIFLLMIGLGGQFFSDLLWSLAGFAVLLSAITAALASRLVERSATARLLVTAGSAVPLIIIASFTALYFISGGTVGFLPVVAILICAAYAFGLVRLRRPDVQQYFWSLESDSLSPGPGISESAGDDEDVVFAGLEERGAGAASEEESGEKVSSSARA